MTAVLVEFYALLGALLSLLIPVILAVILALCVMEIWDHARD